MPIQQLVVVADAHLGAVPAAVEENLLHFLDEVPSLGDGLLVNGDLFGFWFGFRRAIPRTGLRVVTRLAALARRLPVYLTGGNHDRWGEAVWEELGIHFAKSELNFSLGTGGSVLALHGDGLREPTRRLALRHRLVSHPIVSAGYRILPADLGFRLMTRFGVARRTPESEAMEARAAALQLEWARERLEHAEPGSLLVMGHTHVPRAEQLLPGRRYLNPGAWLAGGCYAVATETSLSLRRFPG